MAVRDIQKLPGDGYLIFPLSMSRLQGGQSAEECYKAVEYFESKISNVGIDAVFLYTNGLYYNNDESALEVRKRTNVQMIAHRNALLKSFSKGKKYITQAMHFLPWDYVLLGTPKFDEYLQLLKKVDREDEQFHSLVVEGLKDRESSEANINFLIEEIVVSHLIREGMIEFPKTLVKKDTFRLISYPGKYFEADKFQWMNDILPKNSDYKNPYSGSHYDLDQKLLYNFDEEDQYVSCSSANN